MTKAQLLARVAELEAKLAKYEGPNVMVLDTSKAFKITNPYAGCAAGIGLLGQFTTNTANLSKGATVWPMTSNTSGSPS